MTRQLTQVCPSFMQPYKCRNVLIEDCRFKGAKKADIVEHVEGLVLENVYSEFGG